MNNQEIIDIERMICRWKNMARQFYFDKEYEKASQCKMLRRMAIVELDRLRGGENV